MYNDHLSHEEAQMLIEERTKEAEIYNRQKQLGFGDSQAVRWAFLLLVIVALVGIGLLL
jgi:hypothetical protein